MSQSGNDELKLSRAVARRIKKVATGPLLGPITPGVPAAPVKVQTTVARLGHFKDVQARIQAAQTDA